MRRKAEENWSEIYSGVERMAHRAIFVFLGVRGLNLLGSKVLAGKFGLCDAIFLTMRHWLD